MKDTLTQDKGAKFFNAILEFLENNKSASNNKCYEYMMGNVTEVEETEDKEESQVPAEEEVKEEIIEEVVEKKAAKKTTAKKKAE